MHIQVIQRFQAPGRRRLPLSAGTSQITRGRLIYFSDTSTNSSRSEVMFRKLRPTNSTGSGSVPNPSQCEWVYNLRLEFSPLTAQKLPAKRQRAGNALKILLDVAKESSDWFPPLKAALGGVNALIKHYEVFVE